MAVVVPGLRDYLIPANELQYGEYVYRIEIGLESVKGKPHKYRYSVDPNFYIIICALLNTCGGVIQLIPRLSDKVILDEYFHDWQNSLKDKLNFAPEDVYQNYISLHKDEHGCIIFVRKYKEFITMETHMYARGMAAIIHVQDHKCIVETLRIKGKPIRRTYQFMNGPHEYMSVCTDTENKHLEFKCYKCAPNTTTIGRLAEDNRCVKALLGMANTETGGYVVIGIKEDEKSKQNRYIGQQIEVLQEEDCKNRIGELLRCDSDGRQRHWGEATTGPIEGIHWACEFIPLKPPPYMCSPQCRECPHGKRRVLIVIRILPCTGGVFARSPESFVINDNGLIRQLTMDEWRLKHKKSIQKRILSAIDDLTRSSVTERDTSACKVLPNTPATSPGKLKDGAKISFSEHGFHLESQSTTQLDPYPVSVFRMENPIHYTPSREAIENKIANSKILPIIDNDMKKNNAFGLASTTFYDELESASGGLTICAIKKPTNHLIDLLVMNSVAEIFLYIICSTFALPLDKSVLAYGMILTRIMKKKILEFMDPLGDFKLVNVRCIVCDINLNVHRSPEYYLHSLPSLHDRSDLDYIRSALAKVLAFLPTQFRDDIYRDADVKLSQDQIDVVTSPDRSHINIIEGPPGCGKTLLAQSICEKGENKAAYISGSAYLNKRVCTKVGPIVYHAVDTESVCKLIQGKLKKVPYIVIDDNQNYNYPEHILRTICTHFMESPGKFLYVFEDCTYQNYKTPNSTSQFRHFLANNQETFDSVYTKTLREIRRNSRAVGSFIQAQITDLGEAKAEKVKIASRVKGDNTNVTHVNNIRVFSANNGLLAHVKMMTLKSEDINHHQYATRDITVLVDHDDEQKANEETEFFRGVFRKYWPESNVQGVEVYPVEGVIIDQLDNFSGLESPVVVFVMPKCIDTNVITPQRNSLKNFSNAKYRVAISSRGRDRVDFLQEENIDSRSAAQMKFDRLPTNYLAMATLRRKKTEQGILSGPVDSRAEIPPDTPALASTTDKQDESARVKQRYGVHVKFSVAYSYTAQEEDELNIEKGDIITVLDEFICDGWAKGELYSKIGVFPDNFGTYSQMAHVTFAYESKNDDELTLKEGDIINVLDMNTSDVGWWEGEQRGKIGVFPDNFVKLIPKSS